MFRHKTDAKATTTATTKPAIAATKAKPAKVATATKADGTQDMRYKENKTVAAKPAATGSKKADGTPDMRYKQNQKAKIKKLS